MSLTRANLENEEFKDIVIDNVKVPLKEALAKKRQDANNGKLDLGNRQQIDLGTIYLKIASDYLNYVNTHDQYIPLSTIDATTVMYRQADKIVACLANNLCDVYKFKLSSVDNGLIAFRMKNLNQWVTDAIDEIATNNLSVAIKGDRLIISSKGEYFSPLSFEVTKNVMSDNNYTVSIIQNNSDTNHINLYTTDSVQFLAEASNQLAKYLTKTKDTSND